MSLLTAAQEDRIVRWYVTAVCLISGVSLGLSATVVPIIAFGPWGYPIAITNVGTLHFFQLKRRERR